ncbi:MAG: sugar kinase [Subtercola sp.]|nr:sugar kinase [Subtercola sp.]
MTNDTRTAPRGVVTFGETMALVSADAFGPLQHSSGLTLGIGGAESNVAIGLSRLGERVTWIGKVGQDPFGDLVVREIRAEGVRVIGIRDDDSPTALMVKERRTSAETRIWYYRAHSAGSKLGVDDIDFDLIRQAGILHITGISPALSPRMADLTDEAMRVARESGVTVSLDLNYRGKLWTPEEAGRAYRRMIPQADLVFGGDDEVAIAIGRDDSPMGLAHGLIDLGASEAVVKLGPLGAVAVIGGEEYRRAAVPIEPIDTVGAGDAFVAGYLSEYLRDEPAEARLATGVTVGAYACLVPGDWEGLPHRGELGGLTPATPVTR